MMSDINGGAICYVKKGTEYHDYMYSGDCDDWIEFRWSQRKPAKYMQVLEQEGCFYYVPNCYDLLAFGCSNLDYIQKEYGLRVEGG